MKWGSILNLLLGVWLLCSPWAIGTAGALATNAIIFGIVAILVAWWSLVAAPEIHTPAMVNLAAGIWLFVAPWVLGYTDPGTRWNNLLVGVLMVIFGLVRSATPHYRRANPA